MGKNSSWVIEVNEKVKCLADIKRDQETAWNRHSIYKLPASITDRNRNAYEPRTISFGPYHHGKPKLLPMELHKERALLHFLRRSGKPHECYINELGGVIQDLKDSYESLDKIWQQEESDGFLKLMICDGCFMLEFFRSFSIRQTESDYAENDPVFSEHGRTCMLPYISRDVLMLENQLPMLLLRKLHDVYKQNSEANEASLNQLISNIYLTQDDPPINLENCLHLLHLYRMILLGENGDSQNEEPTGEKSDSQNQEPTKPSNWEGHHEILPVVKLEESGIQIKMSKSGSLLDIKFDLQRGILWLPRITVDDASETTFLNMLAFERFHAGAGNEVTCYIEFMDKLIDNSKDVDILQSHEIIFNLIGSNKVIAKLFNSLSEDVLVPYNSRFNKVYWNINGYCKTKWHKWRASLIHTYCTNPWVITSVIAAFLLFALTIFQAVYGALQYYQG